MWTEIGRQLKQARQQAGLSLEALQERTRIPKAELSALETGEFHRLPSPFYVRSYLRSYAEQVGLEPTKLLRKYRAGLQQADHDPLTDTERITPPTRSAEQPNPEPRFETDALRNTQRHTLSRLPSSFRPGRKGTHAAAHRKNEKGGGTQPSLSQSGRFPQSTGSFRPVTGRMKTVEISPDKNTPPASTDKNKYAANRPPAPALPAFRSPSSDDVSRAAVPSPETSGNLRRSVRKRVKKRIRSLGIRNVWAATFAALLLIPAAAWGGYHMLNANAPSPPPPRQEESSESVANASVPAAGSSELALVHRDETSGKSEYEFKNNQDAVLEIRAKDTCWVQIKENPNGGYLKDVTLEKGEVFRFRHPKNVTTDLWISLGSPQKADVTINGQTIHSTQTIHIMKKQ